MIRGKSVSLMTFVTNDFSIIYITRVLDITLPRYLTRAAESLRFKRVSPPFPSSSSSNCIRALNFHQIQFPTRERERGRNTDTVETSNTSSSCDDKIRDYPSRFNEISSSKPKNQLERVKTGEGGVIAITRVIGRDSG